MSLKMSHAKDTKVMPVIDLQNIILRLLMIGQWRGMELEPLFAYVLCAVPPALIDKHGCLRKPSKSGLMKRLGVLDASPAIVDVVIVDVPQLFYHIVWRHGSAKDHERLRRASESVIVYEFSTCSTLPKETQS